MAGMDDSTAKPARSPRKIPRKPNPASLERAALHYLERFASSAENLRRVLSRKVERAARHHEDIDREAAAGWIDDLIARYRQSGLLDDKVYAEARTTSLHRRGASARKIRLSLAQKGVAAAAVAMHRVAEIRRARISGRMDNHERHVGSDWVVSAQGSAMPVTIRADREGATVRFADGEIHRVASDWVPGQPLARLMVDGMPLVLKVARITGGYRLRLRGADLKAHIRTLRQAELAALMPEKLPPDTSKLLLCPMPGLMVKLSVAEGDEVFEGQALCTVEAMKMENILRAERRGTVKKINADVGGSLAVDDVIMEFE